MACEHCGSEEPKKKKSSRKPHGFCKKYMFNIMFWKSALMSIMHMAGTIICLHDLGIMLLHSFFPNVLEHSTPIFLDKLLEVLAKTLTGGF